MTERERTIIRVLGLAVHAAGLVVLLLGVFALQGVTLLGGLIMFMVGGAWGWGMVLAAARRDAQDAIRADARVMAAQRAGFTAAFDDEPERYPRTIEGPVGPPPGTGA